MTDEADQNAQPNSNGNSGDATERPEWLQDKYLEGGRTISEAISVQAQSANELRKKLSERSGSIQGAPDEYEMPVFEGSAAQLDPASPLYKATSEAMKKIDLNQESHNEMVKAFVDYTHGEQEAILGEIAAEKEQVGNFDERALNLSKFLEHQMGEGGKLLAEQVDASPKLLPVLEQLVKGSGEGSGMPDDVDAHIKSQPAIREQLKAMQFEKDANGNRRIETDKAFKDRYFELAKKVL